MACHAYQPGISWVQQTVPHMIHTPLNMLGHAWCAACQPDWGGRSIQHM